MSKGVWIPSALLKKKNIVFMYELYKLMRKDPSFSAGNAIKAARKMLEGEKVIEHNGQYMLSSFLPPFPSRALMTHALAVKDKDNIYTSQMLAKRTAPISFYIGVTGRCYYNCLHCSAKGKRADAELTTDQWKKVIRDIQDMNTPIIGFTGGDPLMREDIEELIAAVDDRSMTILFTTGKGLTFEKALALKKSGLFGIAVSLDSADPEKHNSMRRDDNAFSTALEAVDNVYKTGMYTMINTVIVKNELSEENLLKLLTLAEKHGVHEVRILEPIVSGNLFDRENAGDIFYSQRDRERLIDIQSRFNKRKDLPKISAFAHTESPKRYGCGAGTQHSYISSCGDLYPCDFVPLSFGNVKETSIRELWAEMNEAIGLPKGECFAFKLHGRLKEISGGKLPLDKDTSIELCKQCKAQDFPYFYKAMQGKKYVSPCSSKDL
ncbi:MAG: radical SAM/SPASM domain-containing protein [Bacillota bacterium]